MCGYVCKYVWICVLVCLGIWDMFVNVLDLFATKWNWKQPAARPEDNAADSNSKEINRREEENACDMSLLNYTLASPQ